jgi:hypothetical protein
VLTINAAVLLVFIVVMRLQGRTEARSRGDKKMTVLIVLVFDVMIASTPFGQADSRPSREQHRPRGS